MTADGRLLPDADGTDVHSRVATLCRRTSPAASEQSNREHSQKRALALVHHRRINSMRHNDADPLTRSFTSLFTGMF
jgi:hypothetical protein